MNRIGRFVIYVLLLALIPTALLHGLGKPALHSYYFGVFLALVAHGLDRLFEKAAV